jgi:hypothetical protein
LSAPPGAIGSAQAGLAPYEQAGHDQSRYDRPSGRVGKLVRSIESVPFDRVKRALLLSVGIFLGAVLMLAVILVVSLG